MRLSAQDRALLRRRNYRRWFHESRPAWRRQQLRDHVAFCLRLGLMLEAAGIDPGRCRGLRLGDEAAAELAAIPDTPELEEADREMLAADPNPPDARLGPAQQRDWQGLLRLAQSFADGAEPDFDKCALMEAYAFCVARLNPEAWGLAPPPAPPSAAPPAG